MAIKICEVIEMKNNIVVIIITAFLISLIVTVFFSGKFEVVLGSVVIGLTILIILLLFKKLFKK